jgi:hypothetical protein
MSDDKTRMTNAIDAIEAAESAAKLPPSLEERSHRLALACRAAAALARDRRRAGLPEPKPEPWPASTWEFLAKQTRAWRRKSSERFADFQPDAPACDNCGAITVRKGNCYLCHSCGSSMGCS